MFHAARRPVAALALFMVFALTLAGCRSIKRVSFNSTERMDQTTGITTRSGQASAFEPRGVSVRNDTLFGTSHQGQVRVPSFSVTDGVEFEPTMLTSMTINDEFAVEPRIGVRFRCYHCQIGLAM